ncbi:palmitoyl-acyl carrier protein thioesterase, chloroplastic-like [Macadamia integrifolia]|uniref:palmitoyl-acyl carrier protein thioesterase, chloroplastic-like n=1 Tax=Macadamia integrifolia TaxID=60698 RepID=UPI001C4F8CCE|nr:palmitoyl-acyl carrier protein thioesterase, chloroplastic-like [Macadamia integrifolia]
MAGMTLLFPSPASTLAKRTTRMMLRRKDDSFVTHGMKSKSSLPPLSPYFSNGFGKIVKMAGEELWKLLERRERHIFCENFKIRSYDMGPNRTASIESLMNLLQETALNHIKSMGMMKDGLGSTSEMSRRNLIWVFYKMHIVVDHYPSWGDDIQVETWLIPSETNGERLGWIIHDCKTGKILTRATSVCVMMNKETRKISKIPEEVSREWKTYYMECPPISIPDDEDDGSRIAKFDYNRMDYVRTGLTPRWNDLDANQHMNNVKYIGLMLESVPVSMLKRHEICEIEIEYRRECGMDAVLESLTSCACSTTSQATDECLVGVDGGGGHHQECFHLLRFENGAVVARGRTKWRAK